MMELDDLEMREAEAKVQIERLDNGYIVRCAKPIKEKRTIRTMFGNIETRVRTCEMVFPTLADAVKFLGEHYKEPTVGVL